MNLTSPGDRGTGTLYGYDKPNARIVAFDKASGSYTEQYRITLSPGWQDLRGFYVVPGANGDPATLFWIDGKRLYSSTLKGLPTAVVPVPSAGAGGSTLPSGTLGVSASGSPSPAGSATARPARTPVATSTP